MSSELNRKGVVRVFDEVVGRWPLTAIADADGGLVIDKQRDGSLEGSGLNMNNLVHFIGNGDMLAHVHKNGGLFNQAFLFVNLQEERWPEVQSVRDLLDVRHALIIAL